MHLHLLEFVNCIKCEIYKQKRATHLPYLLNNNHNTLLTPSHLLCRLPWVHCQFYTEWRTTICPGPNRPTPRGWPSSRSPPQRLRRRCPSRRSIKIGAWDRRHRHHRFLRPNSRRYHRVIHFLQTSTKNWEKEVTRVVTQRTATKSKSKFTGRACQPEHGIRVRLLQVE